MTKIYITFITVFLSLFASLAIHAQTASWDDYYQINTITLPKEIDPQIGGLTVLKDGRIAAAFHAGEVAIYSPDTAKWTVFAKGLHEPLGILEEASGALVVMQMPELTRLIDEDKDGVADFYQTITDDFGMSGNYHEFSFGPAKDSKGNFYIALNVASNYAGIYQKIRGEFNTIGLSREAMTNWRNDTWKNETRHQAGRMFSKVPYRGWVLKVSPEGDVTPFASGFRSPNGLWVDQQDKLWVTDNQGDWLGTSPLYQVEQGKFYGHPASLVWQKNWQKNPVEMSAQQLAELKSPAAALFPHGELANSPTQPLSTISPKLFGLPAGELLIGDMNQSRLIRYLADNVKGTTQGTLIPFFETQKLGIGNNRMSFDNQGQLWLGKTHLGWAGDEGIRTITWNKTPIFLVNKVELTAQGFDVSFNQAFDQTSLASLNVEVTSHGYHYHQKYGSEKINVSSLKVSQIKAKNNHQTLSIAFDGITEDKVYTLAIKGLTSDTGKPLMGDVLRYTLIQKH